MNCNKLLQNGLTYTEPKKKLPLCLSAYLHKDEK